MNIYLTYHLRFMLDGAGVDTHTSRRCRTGPARPQVFATDLSIIFSEAEGKRRRRYHDSLSDAVAAPTRLRLDPQRFPQLHRVALLCRPPPPRPWAANPHAPAGSVEEEEREDDEAQLDACRRHLDPFDLGHPASERYAVHFCTFHIDDRAATVGEDVRQQRWQR
eukprot:CAMPEP_0119059300 /NCGR_PEP_ID=MMETSP1178-20130426/3483_1 /TAXON_ID=33656 /ORGANISM="unid sp, Strain CCMP2000" /LENGTH=164 /DNA_ID=CAMNT_0007040323 /DNA_START=147 /DNA_END=643 /DNA_ORIENTATION=-